VSSQGQIVSNIIFALAVDLDDAVRVGGHGQRRQPHSRAA
jgi:hypothetical protein